MVLSLDRMGAVQLCDPFETPFSYAPATAQRAEWSDEQLSGPRSGIHAPTAGRSY